MAEVQAVMFHSWRGGVTERQMKSLAKSSKSFHWRDKETAESLSHIKTCEVESQCELLY